MYDRLKYRIYYTVTGIWFTFVNRFLFLLHGVKGGRKLRAQGIVYVKNTGRMEIGQKVTLNSAGWANPVGLGKKLYLQTLPGGHIIIGEETGISAGAICSAEKVQIGKRVMIGADVKIYDTDFHPVQAEARYEDKPAAVSRL